MRPRRRGHAHVWPRGPTELELVGTPPGSAQATLPPLQFDADHPFERGDFIVAGRGLGAGTITDRPALALLHAGVSGVLAESIHGAFRDSLLHLGIPVLLLPGLASLIRDGDDLIVDFEAGTIENVNQRRVWVAAGLNPREVQRVREAPALHWYGLAPPSEEGEDAPDDPSTASSTAKDSVAAARTP